MSNQRRLLTALPAAMLIMVGALLFVVSPVHAEGEPLPLPAEPGETVLLTTPVEPVGEGEPAGGETNSVYTDPVVLELEPAVSETELAEPAEPQNEVSPPPVVESQPAEEPANPVVEVAAELAENGLALADADNEAPLSTAEAIEQTAEIPDPYFYVGSIVYRFVGDCTPYNGVANTVCTQVTSGNPIQSAIDYIKTLNKLPNDRLIYVETGTFNGNVRIDTSEANSFLLGGLRGIIGKGAQSAVSNENSYINGTLTFIGLREGFLLQGFNIYASDAANPAVLFSNSAGTIRLLDLLVKNDQGDGIKITNHDGAVDVRKVTARGSRGQGLAIDNAVRIFSVTIINTEVDENGTNSATPSGAALFINSKGTITLNGVSASKNRATGAGILATSTLTVTNSIFSNNQHDAAGHGGGLWLDEASTATVTLNNVLLHNNEEKALRLYTHGRNITLTNVMIQGNGNGVTLDTCALDGGLCVGVGTGSVTLTGIFMSNNSGSTGLEVLARGPVYFNNVNSSNNGYGARINNANGPVIGSVSILNSLFNYNGAHGLEIDTRGAVALTNVDAAFNQGFGVDIDSTAGIAAVTISSTGTEINNFDENQGLGLSIQNKQAITVRNTSVEHNRQGAILRNDSAALSYAVTLANVQIHRTQNGNGLTIYSKGAVSLSQVNAKDNSGGYGALIDNSSAPSEQPVTILRGIFDNNDGTGLTVLSRGWITLNNVSSVLNINGLYSGAILDNTAGTRGVTIASTLGANNFDINDDIGLWIKTKGPVTLSNVSASDNLVYGARIQANSGTVRNPVTIISSTFYDNQGSGLEIQALGAITIQYSEVDNNRGPVTINNCQDDGTVCRGLGNVTVIGLTTRRNSMSFNEGSFSIIANGAIYLANVSMRGMGKDGVANNGNVYLDNCRYDIANGVCNSPLIFNVTLVNVEIIGNRGTAGSGPVGTALFVRTNGAITLNGVIANEGRTYGADLNNTSSPSSASVSITNSTFSKNGSDGLFVLTKGAIAARGLTLVENSGDGANLDNMVSGFSPGITLTLVEARSNNGAGIYASTKGVATLTTITALRNGTGIDVYANSVINLTGITASNNNGTGVIAEGRSTINGRNMVVNNNGSHGLQFLNNQGGIFAPVSLINITAENNGGVGILVTSNGAITLSTFSGRNNGSHGASLSNQNGAPSARVTVTGIINVSSLSGNGGHGLFISSMNGATISRLIADNNQLEGIHVESVQGSVSVVSAVVRLNKNNGLNIDTKGVISLNAVNSMSNGRNVGGNGHSGALLSSHEFDIFVVNSAFVGNGNHGIYALTEDGSSIVTHKIVLSNTMFFGNRLDGGANSFNLYYNGLATIA